jgi:hypothetical protein
MTTGVSVIFKRGGENSSSILANIIHIPIDIRALTQKQTHLSEYSQKSRLKNEHLNQDEETFFLDSSSKIRDSHVPKISDLLPYMFLHLL